MATNKILAVIVVAMVALACCVGAVALNSGSGQKYTITYELNGGENSESNPTSYTSGETTTLHSATKDGYVFYSWYYDSDLTEQCSSIGSDVTGNVTLYAKWTESLEGKGFTLSISGTVKQFISSTFTGTATYKYLYYDSSENRYFMQYSTYVKYSYGQEQTNGDTYWTDEESDITWTQSSDEEIDTANGRVLCEVFKGTHADGSVETQWIGDGWIPYKIIYESSSRFSTTSITYTYTNDFTFDVSNEYDVTAYSGKGISVTGEGTYNPGEMVTLKADAADETTFKGWYDENMTLLSSASSYSFTVTGTDVTVFALNDSDYDLELDSDVKTTLVSENELTEATWKIVDSDGNAVTLDGVSPTYTFSAGEYSIYVEGKNGETSYHEYYTAMVNGTVSRTFTWTSDGTEYKYTMTIDYSDLQYYRNYYDASERWQGTTEHDRSFVTYTDKYIVEIAEDFGSMTSGMTDLQVATFIMKFTQYIEYQDDETYMGYEEYWKFPLETLFDEGGDCEDTSILFCSIAKAMGYDTAMLLFDSNIVREGHMAGSICIDGIEATIWYTNTVDTTDKNRYYYCETTTTVYDVGDVPRYYESANAVISIV